MAVTVVLDAGGSRLKWGAFHGGTIGPVHSAAWNEAEAVFRAWAAGQGNEMRAGMLQRPATPAARDAGFLDWLRDALGGDPTRINPAEIAPFAIDYAQGEAGADRLAAAVACHDRDPGGSFVIIDAGTCITVDLLSPGRWRGGAILPGLGLQSASLADAGLPVLEKGEAGWSCRPGAEGALGRSTREAIEAGIPWATREAVTATARALMELDPCAQPILTGGDADHFDGIGGWRTFADPNLVLNGTARLLNALTA